MTNLNSSTVIRRLYDNPKRAIENAQRGSIQDLTELANFWQETPQVMISLGILDTFFRHLDSNMVPTDPSNQSIAASRAFMSLLGVSKSGNVIGDGERHTQAFIKAWPGIFKWSAFFFAARVQTARVPPESRRNSIDVITACWYSISRDSAVRAVMSSTIGSVEIATQLWIIEDVGPIPSSVDVPSGTAALDALLRDAEIPTLDRVLKASGRKADDIAQLAISRLRSAVLPHRIHGIRMAIFGDLINQLSRQPEHPLRYALLSANVIPLITKALVAIPIQLSKSGDFSLLDGMVAGFTYIYNCLESTDGFTWVTQSVHAGLLTAFVDCSPHFSKLNDDDCKMILSIVEYILPKYLVYRSVILAIDGSIQKIEGKSRNQLINNSVAKDVWAKFHKLALQRLTVTIQATAIKGKAATCDNVQCQKVDVKNNFRKCSSCSTTLYCSKECQVAAWKDGGHKIMCKLKQTERLEGKVETISKRDIAFFHHLATRDARHHLPHLRRLASQDLPGVELTGLIICIDYTELPEVYSVIPLAEAERYQPVLSGTANAEARNEALIERARDYPGKYTLIQSKIANGQSRQLVLTVVTGAFWSSDKHHACGERIEDGDKDCSDEDTNQLDRGTSIDEVDTSMGRMILNQIIENMGEPPLA